MSSKPTDSTKIHYLRGVTTLSATLFSGVGLAWSLGAGPAMRSMSGSIAREFFKNSFSRIGYMQVGSSLVAMVGGAGLVSTAKMTRVSGLGDDGC